MRIHLLIVGAMLLAVACGTEQDTQMEGVSSGEFEMSIITDASSLCTRNNVVCATLVADKFFGTAHALSASFVRNDVSDGIKSSEQIAVQPIYSPAIKPGRPFTVALGEIALRGEFEVVFTLTVVNESSPQHPWRTHKMNRTLANGDYIEKADRNHGWTAGVEQYEDTSPVHTNSPHKSRRTAELVNLNDGTAEANLVKAQDLAGNSGLIDLFGLGVDLGTIRLLLQTDIGIKSLSIQPTSGF